jgi:hypothetical protein
MEERKRLPVVLTQEEGHRFLTAKQGTSVLMAQVAYEGVCVFPSRFICGSRMSNLPGSRFTSVQEKAARIASSPCPVASFLS